MKRTSSKSVVSIFFVAILIAWQFATKVEGAGNSFSSQLIPCGQSETLTGCGSNPPASDPLREGWIQIKNNGRVELKIKGSMPHKTYLILITNWISGGGPQMFYPGGGQICPSPGEITSIVTDMNGNFSGKLKDPETRQDFIFPSGTAIGQPNFAINDPDCMRTQFTSGFSLVTANHNPMKDPSLPVAAKVGNSTAEQAIEGFYREILGREPEAQGFNYWLRQHQNGMSLEEIKQSFYDSSEYQSKNQP